MYQKKNRLNRPQVPGIHFIETTCLYVDDANLY